MDSWSSFYLLLGWRVQLHLSHEVASTSLSAYLSFIVSLTLKLANSLANALLAATVLVYPCLAATLWVQNSVPAALGAVAFLEPSLASAPLLVLFSALEPRFAPVSALTVLELVKNAALLEKLPLRPFYRISGLL